MVYGIWYRICSKEIGVHYGCFYKLGLLSKGGAEGSFNGVSDGCKAGLELILVRTAWLFL